MSVIKKLILYASIFLIFFLPLSIELNAGVGGINKIGKVTKTGKKAKKIKKAKKPKKVKKNKKFKKVKNVRNKKQQSIDDPTLPGDDSKSSMSERLATLKRHGKSAALMGAAVAATTPQGQELMSRAQTVKEKHDEFKSKFNEIDGLPSEDSEEDGNGMVQELEENPKGTSKDRDMEEDEFNPSEISETPEEPKNEEED